MSNITITPKATIENYNEYKQLAATINENSSQEDINRLTELYDLDWTASEYEENGLKGLKGLEGEVILPARFERVASVNCTPEHLSILPAIVVKDSKFGLAKCNGTGELVVDCKHEQIQYFHLANCFTISDNGLIGLITPSGKEVLPQIAESLYEPCNDILQYKANGKFGLVDLKSGLIVEAWYDEMLVLPEEAVQVIKEGFEGFLSDEDGHFIPKEDTLKEEFDELLLSCDC